MVSRDRFNTVGFGSHALGQRGDFSETHIIKCGVKPDLNSTDRYYKDLSYRNKLDWKTFLIKTAK